jgi:hypothetical protein
VKNEPESPSKKHPNPLRCVICWDSTNGPEFRTTRLACGTCPSLVHKECLERDKAFRNAEKSVCFTCEGKWGPRHPTTRPPVIDIDAEQYGPLPQLRARSRS